MSQASPIFSAIAATPALSVASISVSTALSGWRNSQVMKTSPGITLREFG